jgi:hypothetical protein
MAAVQVYQWDYIAPGLTVGLFLHGFAKTDHGVFDAIPLNLGETPPVVTPVFDIQLTQGEVSIHVDGTYARITHIQNLAHFSPTGVGLFFIYA